MGSVIDALFVRNKYGRRNGVFWGTNQTMMVILSDRVSASFISTTIPIVSDQKDPV